MKYITKLYYKKSQNIQNKLIDKLKVIDGFRNFY